ncbi:hypothetical protein BrE312_3217 [Brenneria sp. EniD312]|nr:hypothetical protein BrE312_3217 [Brenneria sp. EniD312]
MSRMDAAKASAAPDKNAGSVFEQHLCWPVRASPMDGASIPRQWRFDRRPPIPKAPRSGIISADSQGSQGCGD